MSDPIEAAKRTLENAAKATEPSWQRHDTGTMAGVISGDLPEGRAYLTPSDKGKRICYSNSSVPRVDNDMDFIAHVRTDAPLVAQALLDVTAERDRLRAEKMRLREALMKVGKHGGRGQPECWCAGWESCPCINQPQCVAARAALGEQP